MFIVSVDCSVNDSYRICDVLKRLLVYFITRSKHYILMFVRRDLRYRRYFPYLLFT